MIWSLLPVVAELKESGVSYLFSHQIHTTNNDLHVFCGYFCVCVQPREGSKGLSAAVRSSLPLQVPLSPVWSHQPRVSHGGAQSTLQWRAGQHHQDHQQASTCQFGCLTVKTRWKWQNHSTLPLPLLGCLCECVEMLKTYYWALKTVTQAFREFLTERMFKTLAGW